MGRAWRRRVDCVSHSWAVSRCGILALEVLFVDSNLTFCE